MNRKGVLRVLQISTLIQVALVIAIAIVTIFTTDDFVIRSIFIGAIFGVIAGGAVDVFVGLPKKFGNKDERMIIIELLAGFASLVIAFTIIVFSLLLMGTAVIEADMLVVLICIFSSVIVMYISNIILKMVIDRLY